MKRPKHFYAMTRIWLLLITCLAGSLPSWADVVYVIDGNAYVSSYSGTPADVVILSKYKGYDVTSIRINAFRGSQNLRTIVIPGSIRGIDFESFSDCSELSSVTIQEGVRYIEVGAFKRCSKLKSITIPNSVKKIGTDRSLGGCFSGCRELTSITIPNSVLEIPIKTFYGCSGLTSATIPKGITYIGDEAFYGCSQLSSITIPDSVAYIGESAFEGCSTLKSPLIIPKNIVSIKRKTFKGCCELPSITFSPNIKKIEERAFEDCSGLKAITIPDSVTSLGDYAFKGCSGLTSVNIPKGISYLLEIFSGCSGLTSIYIPNNIRNIGYRAFEGCTGLQSITIPNNVKEIEQEAFYNCSKLKDILIPASAFVWSSSFGGKCIKNRRIISFSKSPNLPDSFNETDTIYVLPQDVEEIKTLWTNSNSQIIPLAEKCSYNLQIGDDIELTLPNKLLCIESGDTDVVQVNSEDGKHYIVKAVGAGSTTLNYKAVQTDEVMATLEVRVGGTSNINDIIGEKTIDNAIYGLDGIKIPSKKIKSGVYIINGKKVIIN